MLDRLARFLVRRARSVVVVSVLLLAVCAAYGAGVFSALQQGGFDTPGGETDQEMAAEREIFGNHAADVIVIYSHEDLTTEDEAFRSAVAEVVDRLPADDVAEAQPYYLAPDDSGMVSEDGHLGQLVVSLNAAHQGEYLDAYDRIKPLLEADGLTTELTGYYPIYSDIHHQTSADLTKAELISLPLVLVLSMLIFGSAVAASMPAMIGVTAMVGSLAVVRLLANVTDVSIFVVNVVSLLGIGLAIDYALFIVSRFREELATISERDPDAIRRAVRTTMTTAGRTVLFSGLTVAASMATLLMFPQMFFRSMAYGGVAAVLIAMLASLTVLPAVLVLLGRRVDAGRLPWRRHRQVAGPDDTGRWAALSRLVMRRPVAVLVLSAVLMLTLATPFLGVTWASFDHTALPDGAPTKVAADKLADFGASSSPASIVITDTDEAAVEEYLAEISALREGVAAFVRAQEGDDYLLQVRWPGTSQEASSLELMREMRGVDPPRGEVLIGGLTADAVDLIDSVSTRLPWMAAIVACVMLVLLFIAFGSVVMPIKAMVMNLVSLAACFGVVTWIFADGNLSGALAFEPQHFLDVTNSVLMLVIVFGLSMDYEVFVLSRVREEWDATGDNVRSVATGLQHTGRIITCAAILLGAVVGAFATGGVIVLKMLGVGMLVALLLDATVVRALMVPATMRLLGRWNWWAPAPLARLWQAHHVAHHAAPAAAEVAAEHGEPVRTG